MSIYKVYMRVANELRVLSKDRTTQVGAVILSKDYVVLSTGYNGFPRGINDLVPERQIRPHKYFFMAHAEINAICNATRHGVCLKGSTILVTMFPCADCARAIIQCGIERIIVPENIELRPDYAASYSAALEMLQEADVYVYDTSEKYLMDELRNRYNV